MTQRPNLAPRGPRYPRPAVENKDFWDIFKEFLPGPRRRLAPVIKMQTVSVVFSFFQRYIVRDISLT